MTTYPDYVFKTLARAREEGQWHAAQADAAALCFDILALFPDCQEASDLVYELFCDEWTIYDMRVAIQRNIDEWDDCPWQQRRRLALSFRFMSRWEGKYNIRRLEGEGPKDVRKILEAGKMDQPLFQRAKIVSISSSTSSRASQRSNPRDNNSS